MLTVLSLMIISIPAAYRQRAMRAIMISGRIQVPHCRLPTGAGIMSIRWWQMSTICFSQLILQSDSVSHRQVWRARLHLSLRHTVSIRAMQAATGSTAASSLTLCSGYKMVRLIISLRRFIGALTIPPILSVRLRNGGHMLQKSLADITMPVIPFRHSDQVKTIIRNTGQTMRSKFNIHVSIQRMRLPERCFIRFLT